MRLTGIKRLSGWILRVFAGLAAWVEGDVQGQMFGDGLSIPHPAAAGRFTLHSRPRRVPARRDASRLAKDRDK